MQFFPIFFSSCTWDQKPCSADNFEMYITDHGLCYTFNLGKNDTRVLAATQTGLLNSFYILYLFQLNLPITC